MEGRYRTLVYNPITSDREIDETPSVAPEQQTNDTEQEIRSMKDQDPTNWKIQTKTQSPQSNFS